MPPKARHRAGRRTAGRPSEGSEAVRRPPGAVRVEAHAKLNLGLAVGPRRPDGNHELATIFQSISLADTLVARPLARGFELRVRHENAALRGGVRAAPTGRVPGGETNLVLRAARRFAAETGLSRGARFELVKRIPARAGLGGGSADAAATIAALSALYGIRLSPDRRLAMAAEIGADVPFSIFGGTALGLGRGEKLLRLRLSRPFRALVVVPKWRVGTGLAFSKLDRNNYGLTGWGAKLRFAQSLAAKSLSPERGIALGNSFESVLGHREKDFLMLRQRLERAGLSQIRLTGSGSGVFAVIPPRAPVAGLLARFSGEEALFEVRSTQRGLKLRVS